MMSEHKCPVSEPCGPCYKELYYEEQNAYKLARAALAKAEAEFAIERKAVEAWHLGHWKADMEAVKSYKDIAASCIAKLEAAEGREKALRKALKAWLSWICPSMMLEEHSAWPMVRQTEAALALPQEPEAKNDCRCNGGDGAIGHDTDCPDGKHETRPSGE